MVRVVTLYQFARFDDLPDIHARLAATCTRAGIKGTLLIAQEGINGTIAGPSDAIETVLDAIRALPGCALLEVKESTATRHPFTA